MPEGTKSFALTMFDPEGRAPSGVSHWVAYGIPASASPALPRVKSAKRPINMSAARACSASASTRGPCTPPNTTPHHYTFVLIATDFDPKELPPGLTRDELIAKFGPPPAHVKGSTGLVGLFVNPWKM